MKKNRVLLFVTVCLFVLMAGGNAMAAGSWYSLNLNVPSFGRSAITENRSKVSYNNPRIQVKYIGGNYGMYARMEFGGSSYPVTNYAWIPGDYQQVNLPLTVSLPGLEPMHDRFKSGLSQPVTVNIQGKWSPDNPAWPAW